MDYVSWACITLGLTIVVKKKIIHVLPCPKQAFVYPAMFVYGRHLKVVDHFVYLGSTLLQDNSLDREYSLSL